MSTGFFLAIDEPSGIGKSTVTAALARQLAGRGLPVLATKEPTVSTLGSLARFGTDDYRSLGLACLVAADRPDMNIAANSSLKAMLDIPLSSSSSSTIPLSGPHSLE
ncbi:MULTISPECIES: hypothetical protein [unclassified Frankia]|uniref:hypothetical protein n=1 Tax=unclassified Frankia TaxID=2632575 RepID=UPI001EE4417A|nr:MULTISPECIES: hypothetical protein [unclassified Frankia]